jgi:L-2-hydroxyglutarate oxidase
VAVDQVELPELAQLHRRGLRNGLGLRELGPRELRDLEPDVTGVRALHVPETGVVDFRRDSGAGPGGPCRAGWRCWELR